jgi:4-alpha-glucanotransferase
MEKNGFAWLHARAARSGDLFELYRIDHVIGLYRTWTRSARDPDDAGFTPDKEDEQIRLGETVLGIFSSTARWWPRIWGWCRPSCRRRSSA